MTASVQGVPVGGPRRNPGMATSARVILSAMSDLSRRPRSGVSRTARERRAYRLVQVGGTAAAVAVVTLVLAIAGVMGYGVFLIALVIAAACGFLFRRTVGP